MSATTTITATPSRKVRKKTPWRDPLGRFSWLKATVLLLAILPAVVIAQEWATGQMGPRPVTQVLHQLGDMAVRFLVISLAVTPARTVLDWPRVVLLRRILGVTAACYALAHLTIYVLDQKWSLLKVASEIALRFYLTIGFVALIGLLVLTATSTDGMMRRLGRRWKKLHRLVFAIGVLAIFHYFLQSKADVSDAVFLGGLFLWLMLWRLSPRLWQGQLLLLPVLAAGAGLLTAGIEAAWYGLATGAPAIRVLAANLNLAYGPRPAVAVFLLGLLVFALASLRRVPRWWRGLRATPA